MEPVVYSIAEFCHAHHVSRSKLYELIAEGTAPRIARVGTRRLITAEAAAEWRRARDAEADALATPEDQGAAA